MYIGLPAKNLTTLDRERATMDRYAKGQSRQFARQQDSLAQPVIQAFDFQFKETLETSNEKLLLQV